MRGHSRGRGHRGPPRSTPRPSGCCPSNGRAGGPADLVCVTSSALDRWQCPTLELAPLVAVAKQLRGCGGNCSCRAFRYRSSPSHAGPVRRRCRASRRAGADGRRTGRRPPLGEDRRADLLAATTGRFHPRPAAAGHDHAAACPPFTWSIPGITSTKFSARGSWCWKDAGAALTVHLLLHVMQGRTLRRKTPEQLAGEVETAVGSFGLRNIYFIDLEFTASPGAGPRSVRAICSPRHPRPLVLPDPGRPGRRPLLGLMRRAGCRLIHFGIESGCPRIADLSRRSTSRWTSTPESSWPGGWAWRPCASSCWATPGNRRRNAAGRIRLPRSGSIPPMPRSTASRPTRARLCTSELPADPRRSVPGFAGTEAQRSRSIGWCGGQSGPITSARIHRLSRLPEQFTAFTFAAVAAVCGIFLSADFPPGPFLGGTGLASGRVGRGRGKPHHKHFAGSGEALAS